MIDEIKIKILRDKLSYDFKYDENKNDYKNNIRNNSIDTILILNSRKRAIFVSREVQTVANHPHFDFLDTIAPGKFKMRCFVEQRKYHGRIHGIVSARDLENQEIDCYSMQVENGYQKGRWLIHDRWSFEKERDLFNGYSGGCFVMSSRDLFNFNRVLERYGVVKNDILNCSLIEV